MCGEGEEEGVLVNQVTYKAKEKGMLRNISKKEVGQFHGKCEF